MKTSLKDVNNSEEDDDDDDDDDEDGITDMNKTGMTQRTKGG